MTKYVLGFCFDKADAYKVLLVRKNRPDWQKGKLNGVGGHVEANESPLAAMHRECREETGLEVDWQEFAALDGKDFVIQLFVGQADLSAAKTLTDEPLETVGVFRGSYSLLAAAEIVPNLNWLIPMAFNHLWKEEKCRYFSLTEEKVS